MNIEQPSRTQIRAVTVEAEVRGQQVLRRGLDQPIDPLPFCGGGAGAPSADEALWAAHLAGRKGGEDE